MLRTALHNACSSGLFLPDPLQGAPEEAEEEARAPALRVRVETGKLPGCSTVGFGMKALRRFLNAEVCPFLALSSSAVMEL